MKYFITFMCIVLAFSFAGGLFGITAGVTFTETLDYFGDSLDHVNSRVIKPTKTLLKLLGIDLFAGLDDPYIDDITFHRRSEEDLIYQQKFSGRDFSAVEYAVFEDRFLLTTNVAYYHDMKGELDFVGLYFDGDGMLLYAIAYRNGEAPDQGLDVTSFLDQSFLNIFSRQLIIRYIQEAKPGYEYNAGENLNPDDLILPQLGAKDATGEYLCKEWTEGIFESHFWWIR